MSKAKNGKDGPTVIKKYANRRLYDTGRSSYVTLDDLCEMIQEGHDFLVVDAKSGEDITRSVLAQIIVDQESGEENLLPTNFMRTLISFYGDNFKAMVPSYLDQTLSTFVKNQEKLQEQINKSIEDMKSMKNINPMENIFTPPANFEEMTRQNMEIFERTMKMMAPFSMGFKQNEKQSDSNE